MGIRKPHRFLSEVSQLVLSKIIAAFRNFFTDVWQLLIALPFFDRPVGIPFGILHRCHFPGIDL